jgi:hypothetical protein
MGSVGVLYAIAVGIGISVSGWVVSKKLRRRMKETLGRNPSDIEMASLKTWMDVEQDEELREATKPIHPR